MEQWKTKRSKNMVFVLLKLRMNADITEGMISTRKRFWYGVALLLWGCTQQNERVAYC